MICNITEEKNEELDEKEVSEVEGPSDEEEGALEEEGLWEDSVEDHPREKEGKLWKVRGNPSRGRGIKLVYL